MEGTTPEKFRSDSLSVDEHTSLYGGVEVNRTEGLTQQSEQEGLRLIDDSPEGEIEAVSNDCDGERELMAGEVGLKLVAQDDEGTMTEVAGYYTPLQAEELGKKLLEAAEVAGGDHAAAYGDE
jgi:hypothetical protein